MRQNMSVFVVENAFCIALSLCTAQLEAGHKVQEQYHCREHSALFFLSQPMFA